MVLKAYNTRFSKSVFDRFGRYIRILNISPYAEHAQILVTLGLNRSKIIYAHHVHFQRFPLFPLSPISLSVPFSHRCLTSYVPCCLTSLPCLSSYGPCLTSLFLHYKKRLAIFTSPRMRVFLRMMQYSTCIHIVGTLDGWLRADMSG
jgi:hypothetical protein